jgi:Glycosyl transferases group 1
MIRRPLRIATTGQLERSVQEAGFDAYRLPEIESEDFHRSLQQRLKDGPIYRAFLEKHDIDLILDFNTAALTLIAPEAEPEKVILTNAALGIPYVACYLDPITSTMNQVGWADHWQLLESDSWIKWIPERAHAMELERMGVRNIVVLPMGMADEAFDTTPPVIDANVAPVAFMGHPATSWFSSNQTITSSQLLAAMTTIAVQTGMPDVSFQNVFYDMYHFAEPPTKQEGLLKRAAKSLDYFNQKFTYNAFLAIKHRDRFARFLKQSLGSSFELIGDHWESHWGLTHTPRIWDRKELLRRMRTTPICLNWIKGNWEAALIIRHFEITAVGGFMLTYETGELASCFEIGEECDVFRSEAELLEKIQLYLENPKRRNEIARAGQERTLREHLYSHRIATLVEILHKTGVLPKKVSTIKSASVEQPAITINSDPLLTMPRTETSS